MDGFDELPPDAKLDHETAPPAGQPDTPAAPSQWSKAEEQQIVRFAQTAKTPEELAQFATSLNPNVTLTPEHAKAIIDFRNQHGAVSTEFLAPAGIKADPIPDGFDAVPADAKIDYGTLSGLSPDEIKAKFDKMGMAAPGLTDLSQHGYTAGLDTEVGGVGSAAARLLLHPDETVREHGHNLIDAYHEGRTNALASIDYANMQHPTLGPLAEISGALANPLGGEAKGVTGAMKAGGAYGLVSGFENNNGDLADRLASGAKTGAIGAVAAPVVGAVIKAPGAVRRAFQSRPLSEIGAAAERQGLNVLPADVGGPVTRGMTAATVQFPLGAPPIINAAQKLNQAAGDVVQRHAANIGLALEPYGAGQAAIEGAQKYIKASSQLGGRMYDIAAAKAGDTRVTPTLARQVLDDQIARLEAVPGGGAGLAEAKSLRQSLEGDFSVQGVRDLRTEMHVAPELRGGPVEARQKEVVAAAAHDVMNNLRAAGKTEAAAAFQAADAHWADRLDTIDNVIRPIIGRRGEKSGEQVIKALNAASKTNTARVASFVQKLPEEEGGVVRASILAPLGKDADGNFSISRFATDWQGIGDTAKRALFNKESRAALDDLATVGQGAKAAQKYSNHSNTARGVIAERTFGSVATGATVGLGIATLGKALVMQGGAGLLLSSPRFARWLARAPATRVPLPQYVGRLSNIAAAEPAIANAVRGFQARLEQTFQSEPMRAAADQGNEQTPQ